jgi:hypothetical protein
VILPLLALLALAAAPQAGTSRTTLVTVADARNRPIVDIGPDDVVIREGQASPGNSVAREILSVHTADYPVIVLVDTGAARDEFPQIRQAVIRFIDRLGRRPVAIGTLGDPPALVTSFDDEPEQAAPRLEALTANRPSDSRLLQAVTMAAQKLGDTGSLFSAIIVVSANASDRTPSRPEALIGPIVDSGAIVHVVANRQPAATVAGTPAVERDDARAQMLRTVVQQTLGQFTTIYTPASYQAALDRLADRLSSELMIEYLVPPGSKAGDVKVGVRIPGARVRGLGVRPR